MVSLQNEFITCERVKKTAPVLTDTPQFLRGKENMFLKTVCMFNVSLDKNQMLNILNLKEILTQFCY